MALQIRRGLEADRTSFTPLAGELLYVTDTGSVYVGDGSTAGGTLVTGDVENDTSPALGGDLNLNSNDIVGTGNINIDGTITATGNINLGDESADNVGILGSITTSLTPKLDAAVDIGSMAQRWRGGYFAGLSVDGQIDASTVNANILADDSTIAYNSSNGQFDGTFVGDLVGDVKGSVFGDDSTAIVDAVSNTLRGNLFGDADGNHTGTFTGEITATGTLNGNVTGDIKGSVFADDSGIILDAVNSTLNAEIINTREFNSIDPTQGIDYSTPDEISRLLFTRESDSAIGDTTAVGRLIFRRKVGDAAPEIITSISISNDQMSFIPQPGGTPNYDNYLKVYKTGTVAISRAGELTNAPGDATLEVGGAVLFEPMSTTTRNALTAEVGMVIFNTTDTKLQVCTVGGGTPTWVDLH